MNAMGKKRGKAIAVAPPRVPTPMPPPKDNTGLPYHRHGSSVVGTDASYRLSDYELQAINTVKAQAPRMDKNGYFSYITSTAKKKKISLMQPRPPRVAFAGSEATTCRPGASEQAGGDFSRAPAAEGDARRAMSQRAAAPAPRARRVDYAQLECYQPKYHHIREQCEVKRAPCVTQDYSGRQRKLAAPRPVQHQSQPPPPPHAAHYARASKTSSSSPHRRRRGAGASEEDGGVAAVAGFSAALHRAPPPPPPALLRRLGVKEATGVGKVKVMLRVAGAGEGPFSNGSQTFTLDKRKKQVTLYETPAAGAAPAPDDRKVGVAAPKMFAFDAIFSQDDSQTEICSSALTDVIHAVINGTDGCLFCFGHAGLGKSYTMLGRAEGAATLGAMPCAISWLFRGIAEQRHKCGTRFSVRVSAVELCTNTNQIRDLLAPYHNDSEQSPGVYLRDDPLFGTQLQNHSELRVHSAEKAAFYLDAALATRRPGKDEAKDSHLLYTLHLYQYSVGGKGAVAGGRSRLHLIDLGNSERGKSSGGIPLSGLGNILLAIFNGQRHLPYRDHNLTHVLRECLGSLTCHTAMIVHVSPKEQSYTDTLTTLQLASRIHRLRRRKLKFPAANNAGSGGSSGEDAAKPSSSEPDPSSSDLSADTVIYVGPLDDATDGEHPPVYIPHINSGDNRCVMSKALRGSLADQKHKSSLTRVAEEKSPVHKMHSSPKSSPLKVNPLLATSHSPKHSPAHSANSKVVAKKNSTKSLTEDAKTKSPLHQNTANASTSDEQWIDGPRISKSKLVEARHIIHESQQVKKRETWIDGPMHASGVPLQLGSVPSQVTSATLQSVSTSLQAGTIPLQAGSTLLQIGLLTSQANENVGYGYMDNHKKSMIRKWVENQTCQINKSRHNSPTHKSQQPNYKELTQFKTCDDNDANPKIEPPIKHAVKPLQVEESTIRTGLKAGSKAMGIAEETAESEPPEHSTPSRRTMLRKLSKPEIDEDDDSEELAEIPPALPLIQPLSSREVSMESLDSRLKQRMRMNDDVAIVSNHSREVDQNGTDKVAAEEEEDEILEIIEVDEPLEPVPTQDSCLQVTEEDIALCMGYENPLPEVDQSDSEEHPLRILSQENLTVVSTFTDSLSLYSDVERQIRSDAYLRRALDLYCADFDCSNLLDMDPYEAEAVSRSKLDELLGLRELYRSHAALADAASARTAPQHLQSLSMSNVREPEEFRGDGSVYSEPAYRPSDKICDSCKRTMSRPSSAAGHRDSYCRETCDDGFGPFERYRDGGDATDARIASLRHPDGASDPNLREERRTPGSGAPAPPFREALKASLHLEVAGTAGAVGEARKPGKPDGYDSGHESTPRTGKHSPAATSRRAESGYDSVPRDSDASSLDSYPTRRAARAAAAAAAAAGGGKRATAAKYKQHHDRSFCSWLRNPFTCKYADTDPEISDF